MTAEIGQPGQIIDNKYRIVRLLGTGGMGAVFEGENIRIRRKVAIKMLHGSVSSHPEVIQRFEREAQAAALVGSDHICEVLDLGVLADQTRYMVMEYLDGDTLSGLIKKMGRLKPAQSIPILCQILDALGAAHAAGIIHRDLKPDNVFILAQKSGIQNFVKILDFGVSKFSQLGGEAMNVTRAGAVVGTPYYMSPEQARGSSAIDQRTDIYAIGVLLYQATTGQVPYQAETFNELLFKIVLEVAPPPQIYVPDIEADFGAIIQRAMAREPDQRFQSCQQFKEALLQFQANHASPGFAPAREPVQHRTEVLNLNSLPGSPAAGGASWPGLNNVPIGEGTMPMVPGLPFGGSGAGAPSPLQSGANWGNASNPGAVAVGPNGPSATTPNAWGNESSPSNAVPRPKKGNGMLIGVVAVAALVGVGVAVTAVVMMKPNGTSAAAGRSTSTATLAAKVVAPPVTATAVTATDTATAVVATPTPPPSATETTAPATAPVTSVTATAATPPVRVAGPLPAPKPIIRPVLIAPVPAPKPPPKAGGNDLGY